MRDPATATPRGPARKGQSLWSEAWSRLRKNRFAMGGLVVVVAMSLTAALANVLLPFQPDYGQPWVGPQPPGFAHPAVLAENRFDEGAPVAVPDRIPRAIEEMLSEDGTIVFHARVIEASDYRIRLRRGEVSVIQQQEGARRVERLEVAGEGEQLRVLLRDGEGPPLRDVTIVKGEPLPPELEADARILLVRVERPRTAEPERIEVRLENGNAASILRGGEPLEELRLEGRHVLRVEKDGREVRLKHWLGTDLAGRDELARVIHGGRISLMVGAVATLVSMVIGVVYGAISGYLARQPMTPWRLGSVLAAIVGAAAAFVLFELGFAGSFGASLVVFGLVLFVALPVERFLPPMRALTTTGEFMMRVVDILYALPFMFLVILLMISYGRDLLTLFVALGMVQWLMMARIVRGQVLSLKEKEFVEAAHMAGSGHLGILFRHLIPNTLGVVIVYATLTVPAVILQESFLAFIGLTVEFQGRTLDSWGSLVNQGRQALTSSGGNWWVLVFPSVAMAVTLFSLNFLGDGLRDALDPQQKGRT